MPEKKPTITAKQFWKDEGAGKLPSIKQAVTEASKGKPELPVKK